MKGALTKYDLSQRIVDRIHKDINLVFPILGAADPEYRRKIKEDHVRMTHQILRDVNFASVAESK